MSIAYGNGGAVVWTTANNPVVGYPAGGANDAIVAFAAGKPPAFAASQANYTLLGECVSGTAGAAVDDGPTRNSGFLRTTSPTGAASDTWAVTGSPSPALLRTLRFSRSTGVGWLTSYSGLVDADETGTAVVATAPVAAGQYAAGDMVAITVITKSDAIIHTPQAITIPGVTLEAITWFARYLTTTGADGSAYSGYALVLSGTSTAGDATYTATSNVSGGAATTVSLVRLREDPGGSAPAVGSITQATLAPTQSGTLTATVPRFAMAGTQAALAPTQGGTLVATAPRFAVDGVQATLAPTQAAALVATAPRFALDGAQSTLAPEQAATASTGTPGFVAVVDQSTLAPTQAATATAAPPRFVLNGAQTTLAPEQAAELALAMPRFAAQLEQETLAPTQAGQLVSTAPVFRADVVQQTLPPAQSGEIASEYRDVVITVMLGRPAGAYEGELHQTVATTGGRNRLTAVLEAL